MAEEDTIDLSNDASNPTKKVKLDTPASKPFSMWKLPRSFDSFESPQVCLGSKATKPCVNATTLASRLLSMFLCGSYQGNDECKCDNNLIRWQLDLLRAACYEESYCHENVCFDCVNVPMNLPDLTQKEYACVNSALKLVCDRILQNPSYITALDTDDVFPSSERLRNTLCACFDIMDNDPEFMAELEIVYGTLAIPDLNTDEWEIDSENTARLLVFVKLVLRLYPTTHNALKYALLRTVVERFVCYHDKCMSLQHIRELRKLTYLPANVMSAPPGPGSNVKPIE